VYLYLRKAFKAVLLKNAVFEDESMRLRDSEIGHLTHVFRGTQSEVKAKQIYSTVFCQLSQFTSAKLALIFNGNSASQRAFSNYFQSIGVPTIFCEISNLPGKMLFDNDGVNAKASLYHSPDKLDCHPSVSKQMHKSWIREYEKVKELPVQQGKLELDLIFSYITDYMFSFIGVGVKEESISLLKKIKTTLKYLTSKQVVAISCDSTCLNDKYVFYPTQVRYDSQLILNSDYDNESAIRFAAEHAKQLGYKLYVKVHPAETDAKILESYLRLREELGFYLVNTNTTQLIKNADSIVTINSTVGLEALIYGKQLKVLGRAIYINFDQNKIKAYIHHHLINLDYFSNEPIKPKEVSKIKNLAHF
jgi:capsular polysaccharide export protein